MNELHSSLMAQCIVFEIRRIYHINAPEPWPAVPEGYALIRQASGLSGVPGQVSSQPEGLRSIFEQLSIPGNHPHPLQEENCMDAASAIPKWFADNAALLDEPDSEQALLESMEDTFSALPSDIPGVSLYHQIKTVIAIACVLLYNQAHRSALSEPFSMYSLDFSGIQNFIYTIISTGALRALKTRSLYLSLLAEYAVDLILKECGFSRANLIYAGGGRMHLLLSADPTLLSTADLVVQMINAFLRKRFGASLYLASAWTRTGGEALSSHGGKEPSFSGLFHANSRILSEKKLSRYSYQQLCEMNDQFAGDGVRECAICGNTARLRRWKERDLCETCCQLEAFASAVTDKTQLLCAVRGMSGNGLALPAPDNQEVCLIPGDREDALQALHVYSINARRPDCHATRIYISRHGAGTGSLEDLSGLSVGIRRLGVLRADVDNLGRLFADGFYRPGETAPWKNCTLTHYAALSAALTAFFQRQLDGLLEQPSTDEALSPKANGQGVSVIYAGGDDVFLMGTWNDVLEAGINIQTAFAEYTGGRLTLSAGFGMYPDHTPVIQMAEDTAVLESSAKKLEGKNAIALFGQVTDSTGAELKHEYHWSFLKQNVIDEKLKLLTSLFETDEDKGNSFLYHVLMLYRQMSTQPMAISRLAYLLARRQPDRDASQAAIQAYQSFMKQVYQWALDPIQNAAFQTACLVYVYLNRTNEQ